MMTPSASTPAVALPLDTDLGKGVGAIHESPLLSAARVVLLATLLAAPWAFGAVEAWAWASMAALAVLALFLWGMGCVQQGALKLTWSPLYWPACAFLLLAGVQLGVPLTFDQMATREALLKLTTDLIFFFLAGQLFSAQVERGKAIRQFGGVVTIFAFTLSLFAILQFLTSQRLIYWSVKSSGWIFGPYVNHNHYGGLMEMLIPISIAYFLSRPAQDPLRAILGFALLFPIGSLLLSGSRGAFISLLVEVLILGWILIRRSPASSRRSLATLGVLGILAAGSVFWWIDSGDVANRLASIIALNQRPEAGLGDRLVVARDSLRIIRDHPWLGTGLGSFEVAFPFYQSSACDSLWDHAHNDYVEALAETGLIGGLLVISALTLFFRLAFGHVGARLRHRAGWIQLGAAIGCCGLFVHSFVDFNLHIPANAAWLGVCAAIAVLPRECRSNPAGAG